MLILEIHLPLANYISSLDRLVQKEQSLSNFVHKKNWKKALALAIELNQPRKAFLVISNMVKEGEELSEVLHKLSPDEHGTLLEYLMIWNTKGSKKCDVSHVRIFSMYSILF